MAQARPYKRTKIEIQVPARPVGSYLDYGDDFLALVDSSDDDDIVIVSPPPKRPKADVGNGRRRPRATEQVESVGGRTSLVPFAPEAAPTAKDESAPATRPHSGSSGRSIKTMLAGQTFLRRLQEINEANPEEPPISVSNTVDLATPPLNFQFIGKSVLGAGVYKVDEDAMYGCSCRPENGRHVGCEYTSCECLDQAAQRSDGKKRFPYYCTGPRNGCLQDFYLNSRNHIFECNRLCNCPRHCKNKVVQWGRQVKLEIFKTRERGWGLRCLQDLKKGQFIDIYKGEIITSAEADRREEKRRGKDSYLYTMDKFAADMEIPQEKLYVVDGEFMGGPTRFMNHSCDPNCRQFTVSYNHADAFVYDLALFAVRPIAAHEELTFNYLDKEDDDDDDDDDDIRDLDDDGHDHGGDDRKAGRKNGLSNGKTDPAAPAATAVDGTDARRGSQEPTKCLCGSSNCKGYLWI